MATARTEKLEVLEGLRGYLAVYVLLDHSLEYSGYTGNLLSGRLFLLRGGQYAVDLFVILSGFVICFLLETQRESYRAFIVRRFFRLYPVAILMFAFAIPISTLRLWNATHAHQYLSATQLADVSAMIRAWWDHLSANAILHGMLLHGLVPDALIPRASEAFLDPAWSLSLEWQFYLLAPFVYALLTRGLRTRIALCAGCVAFVVARSSLPQVLYGAALPFHVEFFFLGGVSFFLYRKVGSHAPLGLPVIAACLAIFVGVIAGRPLSLLPVCAWLVVLGLLCAPAADPTRRWLSLPLVHPFVQLTGRLSYCIYLSHLLVLALVQYLLLRYAARVDRSTHAVALFAGTLAVTLPLSALIRVTVEDPFIRWGRTLAALLEPRREQQARITEV